MATEKPTKARRRTSNTKKHQTIQTKQKQTTSHANRTKQNQPTHRTTRRADATQQNEGAGGRKQAETSKQGKSRRPGRKQRQEGESSTSQEGGHVQLYRCPKGILDHPRANTSVPERRAHEQHPPHGGEGKAPHRAEAEAFVAMKRSEDRSQTPTTRDARGMATGPLQIQPDIQGGTSRQLTGPEDTRRQPRGKGRGREPGGSGPNRKHPSHEGKQKQDDNPTKTTLNSSNEREEPRSTTKRKQRKKRTGKGQPKRGHPRQARDARSGGTDPNTTPYKTTRQMSLEGMSIPVYRRTYTQCLSES